MHALSSSLSYSLSLLFSSLTLSFFLSLSLPLSHFPHVCTFTWGIPRGSLCNSLIIRAQGGIQAVRGHARRQSGGRPPGGGVSEEPIQDSQGHKPRILHPRQPKPQTLNPIPSTPPHTAQRNPLQRPGTHSRAVILCKQHTTPQTPHTATSSKTAKHHGQDTFSELGVEGGFLAPNPEP